MAVQVGRTVISFTIKYVQSEKEKLKSDVQKILDAKNKIVKPINPIKAIAQAAGDNNGQNSNNLGQLDNAM